MKTSKLKYMWLFLLLPYMLLSCNGEEYDPQVIREASLTALQIKNGGLEEDEILTSTIDNTSKTIVFDNVPLETPLEKIKFTGKISLGAKLEFETYNFLEQNPQIIKVINRDIVTEYTVKLNLNAPIQKPYVKSITTLTINGEEIVGEIDQENKILKLDPRKEESLIIKNIVLRPERATVVYTAIQPGNVLLESNPGEVVLDFMGMKETYTIEFKYIAPTGVDFTKFVPYDFSLNPLGNPIFPDFSTAGPLARSADFDGNNILIVSRDKGGPKLFSISDAMAGAIDKAVSINMNGVTGGTYTWSSGRLAQGHIYICNLAGDVGVAPLKIYHWTDALSEPTLIASVSGDAGDRFGDSMSMSLDEKGNGYAFFMSNKGNKMLRVKITNFTQGGEPTFIVPPIAVGTFGYFNHVDGALDKEGKPIEDNNEYVFSQATGSAVILANKDCVEIERIPSNLLPPRVSDVRIFTYNKERYMLAVSAPTSGSNMAIAYMYNINNGDATKDALIAFKENESARTPAFTFELGSVGANAAAGVSTGWGEYNDKLYTFAAGSLVGFSVFEFPKKDK